MWCAALGAARVRGRSGLGPLGFEPRTNGLKVRRSGVRGRPGSPLGSVLLAFIVHGVRGIPWVSTGLAVSLAVSCCANELGPCHFEKPGRFLEALQVVRAVVAEAVVLARDEVAAQCRCRGSGRGPSLYCARDAEILMRGWRATHRRTRDTYA